jgi:hypothetical protein
MRPLILFLAASFLAQVPCLAADDAESGVNARPEQNQDKKKRDPEQEKQSRKAAEERLSRLGKDFVKKLAEEAQRQVNTTVEEGRLKQALLDQFSKDPKISLQDALKNAVHETYGFGKQDPDKAARELLGNMSAHLRAVGAKSPLEVQMRMAEGVNGIPFHEYMGYGSKEELDRAMADATRRGDTATINAIAAKMDEYLSPVRKPSGPGYNGGAVSEGVGRVVGQNHASGGHGGPGAPPVDAPKNVILEIRVPPGRDSQEYIKGLSARLKKDHGFVLDAGYGSVPMEGGSLIIRGTLPKMSSDGKLSGYPGVTVWSDDEITFYRR